jgi:hypothetical protein
MATGTENCTNGVDDDNNGMIDCNDFICLIDPACGGGGGFGETDCATASTTTATAWPTAPTSCACSPIPCQGGGGGGESNCTDCVDNDANNMTDCEEFSCILSTPACQPSRSRPAEPGDPRRRRALEPVRGSSNPTSARSRSSGVTTPTTSPRSTTIRRWMSSAISMRAASRMLASGVMVSANGDISSSTVVRAAAAHVVGRDADLDVARVRRKNTRRDGRASATPVQATRSVLVITPARRPAASSTGVPEIRRSVSSQATVSTSVSLATAQTVRAIT